MSEDCKSFIEFCSNVGDDIACDILDTIHDLKQGERRDGIFVSDIHHYDAINCVLSGTVTYDGTDYGFVIESGNNNGTVILEWGVEVKTYVPEQPVIYTFTLQNLESKTPEQQKLLKMKYDIFKETESFKEKVRSYNYDRHFSPTLVIEQHYNDWASKHGLEITAVENI